jgi:ribonuclease VapC
MIIDTSALVALLDQEPEAERIAHALASSPERILSAANLVEIGIVTRSASTINGGWSSDGSMAKHMMFESRTTTERR